MEARKRVTGSDTPEVKEDPQWSLAMEARKRATSSTRCEGRNRPQWSLAMEARKSSAERREASAAELARNGAWPWRPGRVTHLGSSHLSVGS